jgi:AP2 domain
MVDKRKYNNVPLWAASKGGSAGRGIKKPNSNKKYVGVSRIGDNYSARLNHQYKAIYLGTYKTEEEAAKAYDIAALKYFGKETSLNFPDLRQKYVNKSVKINRTTIRGQMGASGIRYINTLKNGKFNVKYKGKEKRFDNLEDAKQYLEGLLLNSSALTAK